jgi:hypothetical protein
MISLKPDPLRDRLKLEFRAWLYFIFICIFPLCPFLSCSSLHYDMIYYFLRRSFLWDYHLVLFFRCYNTGGLSWEYLFLEA